jgi:hypothetical protein
VTPKNCDNGLKFVRIGGRIDPGVAVMSIAAITSSFVSTVGARAASAPAAVAQAPRAGHRGGHDGGHRHELVDAMNQVLGIDGDQTKGQAQAVFRFAHALMQDLRNIEDGGAAGPGRGHGHGNAWGRRTWSDLPQRLDALATATAAPAAVRPEVPAQPLTPAVSIVTQPAATAGLPPIVAATVPQLELPPQPNPVTTTSAALHLMQVPSSRLLEAFAALRRALLDQSDPVAPQASRADLATTLNLLSRELTAGAPTDLPAGSVLNLTA